jgi:hypothetical protein
MLFLTSKLFYFPSFFSLFAKVTCSRYIHLNPVKAGLVESAQEWEFSSYCEYAGIRRGTLPKLEIIRSLFDSEMQYQSFLEGDTLPLLPQVQALMLDE